MSDQLSGTSASESDSNEGVGDLGFCRCGPCLLGGRKGAVSPFLLFLGGGGEESSSFCFRGPLMVVGGAVDWIWPPIGVTEL